MTIEILERTIKERFGGRLSPGRHEPDGKACVLEAAHVAVGDSWSDEPDRWPDIRSLNDTRWSSDELRAEHLIRVLSAYWDWSDWSNERKLEVMGKLVILTVQRVISDLPGLSSPIRRDCREATTLSDAADAANAANAAYPRAATAADAANAANAADAAYAGCTAATYAAATYAAATAATDAAAIAAAYAGCAATADATAAADAGCAATAAADAAAYAGCAATTAAYAATATAYAAADRTLITACDCWVGAVN